MNIKNIQLILVVIILFVLWVIAVEQGIEKREINECYTWQQMSKQFPSFYITQYEAEQCIHHNISIDNITIK